MGSTLVAAINARKAPIRRSTAIYQLHIAIDCRNGTTFTRQTYGLCILSRRHGQNLFQPGNGHITLVSFFAAPPDRYVFAQP